MSVQAIRRFGRFTDVAGTAMLTAASLIAAAAMFAV
jgi:hypothetical protein